MRTHLLLAQIVGGATSNGHELVTAACTDDRLITVDHPATERELLTDSETGTNQQRSE